MPVVIHLDFEFLKNSDIVWQAYWYFSDCARVCACVCLCTIYVFIAPEEGGVKLTIPPRQSTEVKNEWSCFPVSLCGVVSDNCTCVRACTPTRMF
jgi:hypothetical protein